MKNDRSIKTLFFMFLSSLLLFGCSKKYDLDLSNLPKPKKAVNKNKENKNSIESKYLKDLAPLKSSEQLLSKFQFGKECPSENSKISTDAIQDSTDVIQHTTISPALNQLELL